MDAVAAMAMTIARVQVAGIAAVFMLMAGAAWSALYEPASTPQVQCIYVKGQPVAFVSMDSVNIWMTLEKDFVNKTPYLRVWCLYQNASMSSILLDPVASFTMRSYAGADSELAFMRPESPALLLKTLSQAQASLSIWQGIVGALGVAADALSAQPQPTTVEGTGTLQGSGLVVNDAAEKAAARRERRNDGVARNFDATRRAYEAAKSSINDGIIRKNTIFAGGAVNGYMFFPRRADFVKGQDAWARDTDPARATWLHVCRTLQTPETYVHEVVIRVLGDSARVVFHAVTDE